MHYTGTVYRNPYEPPSPCSKSHRDAAIIGVNSAICMLMLNSGYLPWNG
ncbi:MAG: hypothetical protein IKE95_03285 [Methanobrevibacter sp.]|nr:hypothetical protein [Methanobrevibacter sp.]